MPKRYKRMEAHPGLLDAMQSLPAELWDRPEAPPMTVEIPIESRRADICSSCDYRIDRGDPIWWIPMSGLARHRTCHLTEDHNERAGRFVADREKIERNKLRPQFKEVMRFLEEPHRLLLRNRVIKHLQDVDGRIAMRRLEAHGLRVIDGGQS